LSHGPLGAGGPLFPAAFDAPNPQPADSSWATANPAASPSGLPFDALNAWRHERPKGTAGRPSHSICALLDEISAAPPMTLFASTIKYYSVYDLLKRKITEPSLISFVR
jgi:hypothetical protein